MIKHFPITNTDKVIQHYSDKDGVPINYVCTTDFVRVVLWRIKRIGKPTESERLRI